MPPEGGPLRAVHLSRHKWPELTNNVLGQMHDGEMRERASISELHSDSIRDMKLRSYRKRV